MRTGILAEAYDFHVDTSRREMVDSGRTVIVGGGLASARVVKAYRDAGGADDLVLVSADTVVPYHRPPLTKGYLRGEVERDKVFVEPEPFYPEQRVDVRLSAHATVVDTKAKTVVVDDEQLAYDRLVVASGAVPRRLGTAGEDLEGVHRYRTLADATAVRDAAESAGRVLVVGGSFIGMETTASLRTRGVEVTQVERGSGLFAAFGAPRLSESLARLYRAEGVDVVLEDGIAEFRGRDGRLSGAVTQNGRDVEAGLAIVGVGVTPATEFLEGSGIALDDGVIVDERFRTSADGVFAVGDVARFHDPVFGHQRRIEHWSNANYQGTQLGRLLAGEDAPYDAVASFFTEVFGRRINLLGDLDGGHDELFERGRLEDGAVLGVYLRGERLCAVLLHGQDDETQERARELLRAHAPVRDRRALTDEQVSPLDAL
jgi:NADPH-dependent 2,4-dienoyl-CoA reductase/sulfur reductase-like enzyme